MGAWLAGLRRRTLVRSAASRSFLDHHHHHDQPIRFEYIIRHVLTTLAKRPRQAFVSLLACLQSTTPISASLSQQTIQANGHRLQDVQWHTNMTGKHLKYFPSWLRANTTPSATVMTSNGVPSSSTEIVNFSRRIERRQEPDKVSHFENNQVQFLTCIEPETN